jgi:hypothetical protein
MNLQRARDNGTLSRVAYTLGLPLFAAGYVLDVAVNLTIFSVLVLDLPREGTITAHINRLLKSGRPFQKTVARWFCHHLLDAFDPSGSHCKKG